MKVHLQWLFVSIYLFLCVLPSDTANPLLVGGHFQSEEFLSFAEYSEDSSSWSTIGGSNVLNTGMVRAIELIEAIDPQNQTSSSIIVAGRFNFLNHTHIETNFGNIVMLNQSNNWNSVGQGCNGAISAVAVTNSLARNCTSKSSYCSTIIVGGDFTQCFMEDHAAVSFLGGIAFYDLAQETWYSPVSNVTLPTMNIVEIHVSSESLYVVGNHGGNKSSTAGYVYHSPIVQSPTGRISTLNWSLVVQTTTIDYGELNALVVDENGFYIGGSFNQLQIPSKTQKSVKNIAYVSNNQTISSLGDGLNNKVVSMTKNGTTLFVAGEFTKSGNIPLASVAYWNTTNWNAMGEGIVISTNTDTDPVVQIRTWNNLVVVGGAFTMAGNLTVNNIAMWDVNVSAWSLLGDDSTFSDFVMNPFAISFNGTLFVTARGYTSWEISNFIISANVADNLFAAYDMSANVWDKAVFNQFLLTGAIFSMEYYNNNTVIIGGAFRRIGNLTNLNSIALLSYPDLVWSTHKGVTGIVTCMEMSNNDAVFVGGYFQACNKNATVCSSNIGKWSMTEGWMDIGGGLTTRPPNSPIEPFVSALSIDTTNNMLYIGGHFSVDNGGAAAVVGLEMTSNNYTVIQNTIEGVVYAVEYYDNQLFIGGNFSCIVNSSLSLYNFITMNTNTSKINDINILPPTCIGHNECTSQTIFTIIPYPQNTFLQSPNASTIYIGGSFSTINSIVTNGLAQMSKDLTEWIAMGAGVQAEEKTRTSVLTMRLSSDLTNIYIGGSFSSIGMVATNDIGIWAINGYHYSTLPLMPGWVTPSCILNILSDYSIPAPPPTNPNNNNGNDSNDEDSSRVLLQGVIVTLLLVCLLLVVVILVIIGYVYKRKTQKKPYLVVPLEDPEEKPWDDYYSLEWEISYNLLEIYEPSIGKGPNAIVHRANYKGQEVAVKIFSSDVSAEYYLKEGVCRYASFARSLKHPNITHMVGACTDPLSLIVEYASLGSLSDVIRINYRKITWSRIKELSLQICKAMDFLHSRNLCHHHLTSNNVVVDENWVLKVSDAVLSPVIYEGKQNPYKYKRWFAPEVLKGDNYTPACDVYSFAMILYHLTTGEVPFSDQKDDQALADAIIAGKRPNLAKLKSFVPKKLPDLMERCWHANPASRPKFKDILTTFQTYNMLDNRFSISPEAMDIAESAPVELVDFLSDRQRGYE